MSIKLNSKTVSKKWKRAVDTKNVEGVLSTDTSKAFDSPQPPLLLSKFYRAYGFSGCVLDLMRSYSNERKNRVRTGIETTSGLLRPSSRSTLSPQLWNLFDIT